MSGWSLRFREPPSVLLDASPLLPERLIGMTEREIASLAVTYGGRQVPLGELAEIRAGPADTLVIEGSNRKVRAIGRGATRGHLVVEGDAGDLAGEGLTGGRIEVRGSAGDRLAAGMQAGLVEVRGDAGDFACAAAPGGEGAKGGVVLVAGRVGARAGDRMRRGVLLCQGGIGDFAGAFMLGGTIVALGPAGGEAGFAMRRGSLLLLGGGAAPGPTFRDDGVHEFLWLALLERHLAEAAGLHLALPRRLRRLAGCASVGGKGELLLPDGRQRGLRVRR